MAQSFTQELQKQIPFPFQLWSKAEFYPDTVPKSFGTALVYCSTPLLATTTLLNCTPRLQPAIMVSGTLILQQLIYDCCQHRWKIRLQISSRILTAVHRKCILYRPSTKVHSMKNCLFFLTRVSRQKTRFHFKSFSLLLLCKSSVSNNTTQLYCLKGEEVNHL